MLLLLLLANVLLLLYVVADFFVQNSGSFFSTKSTKVVDTVGPMRLRVVLSLFWLAAMSFNFWLGIWFFLWDAVEYRPCWDLYRRIF